MQPVKLAWSLNKEEGVVYLSSDFKKANPTFQIDALNDWIHELEALRNSLLAYEYGAVSED